MPEFLELSGKRLKYYRLNTVLEQRSPGEVEAGRVVKGPVCRRHGQWAAASVVRKKGYNNLARATPVLSGATAAVHQHRQSKAGRQGSGHWWCHVWFPHPCFCGACCTRTWGKGLCLVLFTHLIEAQIQHHTAMRTAQKHTSLQTSTV